MYSPYADILGIYIYSPYIYTALYMSHRLLRVHQPWPAALITEFCHYHMTSNVVLTCTTGLLPSLSIQSIISTVAVMLPPRPPTRPPSSLPAVSCSLATSSQQPPVAKPLILNPTCCQHLYHYHAHTCNNSSPFMLAWAAHAARPSAAAAAQRNYVCTSSLSW